MFSYTGPEIKLYELMQMIRKMRKLESSNIVVVSGSLHLAVHLKIYRKIIEIAKSKEAKVILDTEGKALRVGIQELPDVILSPMSKN